MSLGNGVTNIWNQGEYNGTLPFTVPVTDMMNNLQVGHHIIDTSPGGGSITGDFPTVGELQSRFSNLRAGPFVDAAAPYAFAVAEEAMMGGFTDARQRYFDLVWTPSATLIETGAAGAVVDNGDGTFTITIVDAGSVLTTDDFVNVYGATGWGVNANAEVQNSPVVAATPGANFSYISNADPGALGTVSYGYGFIPNVYGISLKIIACMKDASGWVGS